MAKDKNNLTNAGGIKTMIGLFVIWMAFYLVALAHEISSAHMKPRIQSAGQGDFKSKQSDSEAPKGGGEQ